MANSLPKPSKDDTQGSQLTSTEFDITDTTSKSTSSGLAQDTQSEEPGHSDSSEIFLIRGVKVSLPDLTGSVSKQDKYPAAHGGFADIWICNWNNPKLHSLPQKVAVKVLRSLSTTQNEQRKLDKRLRRELYVWLSLAHPQVLPLYGVASDFGPYTSMVCPWMENGNLNNYLANLGESLTLADRYRILRQVCAGLGYLHSRSVVHGDLTGCNVLIDAAGDACLSDFGLSTILSDLHGASAFTSSIGGNVRFAAPELYRLTSDDDTPPLATTASDVYSFGSIMLQTFTGKIPYHYVRTDGQVLIGLARGIRPRRPLDSSITDSRWTFMCSCWADRPSDRPAIQDVIEYLKDPSSTYTVRTLPELTDVENLFMLMVSHDDKLESWTGVRNNESHDPVVVKFLKLERAAEVKTTILQTLQSIGTVSHKNILPYLGTAASTYDSVGVVMPRLECNSLSVHLQVSFVPLATKVSLLRQVADGVSHLHSLSIVHGGLTGYNILIDRTGTVKLCNYGLIPLIIQYTASSDLMTTYDEDIRWADPLLWLESAVESGPSTTYATDVYSFGRVMLQVFTGNVPFHADWDDVEEFPPAGLDISSPGGILPRRPSTQLVTDSVWKLMMDCWADDPNERPTMEAVSERISALGTSFTPSHRHKPRNTTRKL